MRPEHLIGIAGIRIGALLASRWWELPPAELARRSELFTSGNAWPEHLASLSHQGL